MPFGYPGAPASSARPGTQDGRPAGVLQLTLERVVGGTRLAVLIHDATVERGRAAVAEVVVAVEALDVLVVLLDEVESVLLAVGLTGQIARESVAEAREATA